VRFLHLRVANYRGIGACELSFGPAGITLVQGPNEAGKTSLSEAIGILFEYPDSSKHRNVEAIRPVHRDEGPEIELQAESGPYTFIYFKRFYKKPETRLNITRPRNENLTGREAHERAEAILRETLDIDLWKALIIQQGVGIDQPNLATQTSLSAALDRVAGGRPAGPREEGLFDKVREEYGRYFTERGAERKELVEARRLQTETQAEITKIEQLIRELEQDIDKSAALQRELEQLKTQEDQQGKAAAAYTAALEEITRLENDLGAARLKQESAEKSEQAARQNKETRQGLIDAVANAARDHGKLQGSCGMYLPSLNQAEEEFKKAQATFNQADQRRKEADRLAALRRADFDYYNNKLHLEQLKERKKRIDVARKNAAQAEEVLARNKVNSRALNAIQEAEQALLGAKAQMDIAAPSVHLRGLTKSKLEIDGARTVLGQDEVRTMSVADRIQLTIPGALAIEVVAGTSTGKLSRKVAEAQHLLERACRKAGVDNPEEARTAFEQRREAEQLVKKKDEIEKDNLRDLTYEQLDKKLIGLARNVPDYLARRVQEPTLCTDLESAKKERANAEDGQGKANQEWEEAREGFDAARNVRDELNAKYQKERVQLEMLAKDLSLAHERLDRAREAAPDEELESSLTEAARIASLEKSNVESAEASLKAKNPVRVKALAEAAKGSLHTTQSRRATVQTELTEVQTRLKIHGEEGLHERLNAAQSRSEHLGKDNLALFRRAAAAKLLFETMREERDKARRAYVAPLKEKIEHLGRLVFDDSFEVEISEDLQIASRTANGITVQFNSLSGGTREQLSLIFRLACSMIVARDGGTPLILDDALGYTDPDRLRSMGAVLAKAAKECQIIIFTCIPDRYANVGEACIISLG